MQPRQKAVYRIKEAMTSTFEDENIHFQQDPVINYQTTSKKKWAFESEEIDYNLFHNNPSEHFNSFKQLDIQNKEITTKARERFIVSLK